MKINAKLTRVFGFSCFLLTFFIAGCSHESVGETSDKTLEIYTGPACPLGSLRPPGVRGDCIPESIVYSTKKSPRIDPPVGSCPQYFIRPNNMFYCVPHYDIDRLRVYKKVMSRVDIIKAKEGEWLCSSDKVIEPGWLCKRPCPEKTVETWLDTPMYKMVKNKGNVVEAMILARACIKDKFKAP